jgi:hypothetical protein
MRQIYIQDQKKKLNPINRTFQRLVYLPGAFIIAYGLWLSLTVT